MRKLVLSALIAATAFPVTVQAQSQAEVRHDRREVRQDRREVGRDVARGNYHEAREDRQELSEDRHETREDIGDRNRRWGRDDWRTYRTANRGLYAGGTWRAPFAYFAFRPGVRIAASYYGSRYVINDPWRYRLPPVTGYQRWVRHYNDVILIDTRRGTVVDVIHGFYV